MSRKIFDFDVEIPRQRSITIDLACLASDMLGHAKYEEYDHLTFMASFFVCKQLSHLRSIIELVDVEQYKNTVILSKAKSVTVPVFS
jgi:hypothetical protein